MEDELYISEELEEMMYTHWLLKMRKDLERKQKEEAEKRRALWELFFIANICYLHDREGCPECRRYGLGICPSAKEEGYTLPHDF
jgi:hypothetical protein